jgi:hypothetical protein
MAGAPQRKSLTCTMLSPSRPAPPRFTKVKDSAQKTALKTQRIFCAEIRCGIAAGGEAVRERGEQSTPAPRSDYSIPLSVTFPSALSGLLVNPNAARISTVLLIIGLPVSIVTLGVLLQFVMRAGLVPS